MRRKLLSLQPCASHFLTLFIWKNHVISFKYPQLWWWRRWRCWQIISYLYNCAPGISAPPLGIVISYHPSASGLDTITVTKKYGSYLEMQYNTNYFQMASQLLSLLLSVKLLKITFNPKSLCTNPPNSLIYMHLPGNYSSERPNTDT